MFIVYAIIAITTVSVSKGISSGQAGATTFVLLFILCSIIYYLPTLTKQGIEMTEIRKKIEKKYRREKINSMFSRKNMNLFIIIIALVAFFFSFKLRSFSKELSEFGFENVKGYADIIVYLVGLFILSIPLLKYRALPRGEKRKINAVEDKIEEKCNEEIQRRLDKKNLRVELEKIRYIKGHHFCMQTNVLSELELKDDNLVLTSSYTGNELFTIQVSTIHEIIYDMVESTDNTAAYSLKTYFSLSPITIYYLYITYIVDAKTKYTLKFNIGSKKNLRFDEKLRLAKEKYDNPAHDNQMPADDELIPVDDAKMSIQEVEKRLVNLKRFRDQDLITEEEYTNRKSEILKEV